MRSCWWIAKSGAAKCAYLHWNLNQRHRTCSPKFLHYTPRDLTSKLTESELSDLLGSTEKPTSKTWVGRPGAGSSGTRNVSARRLAARAAPRCESEARGRAYWETFGLNGTCGTAIFSIQLLVGQGPGAGTSEWLGLRVTASVNFDRSAAGAAQRLGHCECHHDSATVLWLGPQSPWHWGQALPRAWEPRRSRRPGRPGGGSYLWEKCNLSHQFFCKKPEPERVSGYDAIQNPFQAESKPRDLNFKLRIFYSLRPSKRFKISL